MIEALRAWWAHMHARRDLTPQEVRHARDEVLRVLERARNGDSDLEEARQLLRDLDAYYHGPHHRT